MLPGTDHRPGRAARRAAYAVLACVVPALGGCDLVARLRDPIEPHHEQYAEGLRASGLGVTALGSSWIDAGTHAVANAPSAALPLRAEGWFNSGAPTAVAWRFASPDGRWLTVRATLAGAAPGRLFIEAFRLPRDPTEPPAAVATVPADAGEVSFRIRRGEDIVVRVQPELLRGGTWTAEVVASDDKPTRAGTE